jgi:hypothetical protein
MIAVRHVAIALSLVACAGCESSIAAPIDPVPGSGGECADGYAPGPFGVEVGDVMSCFCFDGYVDPASGTGPDAVESICLHDLYNPTGSELHDGTSPFAEGTPKPQVLFFNIVAVWCGPWCQKEASAVLPPLYAEHRAQGLELLSVITDSEDPNTPATFTDLDNWVDAFDSAYPTVIDPAYQTATIVDSAQFPGNLLIDTRTMTIVEKVPGKPQASFYADLEALLLSAE